MYNSVVCSTFNVNCSWDGLLEGRNCFCVWSFWCSELCSVDQTVTVQRRSVLDVRGSRVILPALNLTLDEYGSWRVGRVVPMIRSAVRTTLWSLLSSDLVAELNQTVIEVQRMDSIKAESNCFSSSCGRLNFLSYVTGPRNISVVLLSMEGLRALKFKQKHNLCSDDELRSYGSGT